MDGVSAESSFQGATRDEEFRPAVNDDNDDVAETVQGRPGGLALGQLVDQGDLAFEGSRGTPFATS
jgi:hypothetical protein